MNRILEEAKKVILTEAQGLLAILENLDQEFVAAVEILSSCNGKVIVTGVGKSGLIGRKISSTLSSLGTPSFFLNPLDALHGDLGSIQSNDVLIALSHSGATREIVEITALLQDRHVKIIAITGDATSTLAESSDIVLNGSVPNEACPLGLAPTSSSTAALALGDALAACCARERGFEANDFRENHPQGALADNSLVQNTSHRKFAS